MDLPSTKDPAVYAIHDLDELIAPLVLPASSALCCLPRRCCLHQRSAHVGAEGWVGEVVGGEEVGGVGIE